MSLSANHRIRERQPITGATSKYLLENLPKPLGAESRISKMNSSLPESIYEGPIALKMVKSKSSNSAHDQFLEEASICAIFEHKNICKLIGLILGPVQIFDYFLRRKSSGDL